MRRVRNDDRLAADHLLRKIEALPPQCSLADGYAIADFLARFSG
jgi:hypothetical protein